MKVVELLDSAGVHYEMTQHRPTFTAQQMAAEEHVSGLFSENGRGILRKQFLFGRCRQRRKKQNHTKK